MDTIIKVGLQVRKFLDIKLTLGYIYIYKYQDINAHRKSLIFSSKIKLFQEVPKK